MRINFFFESKIFFADKKILIQDKKITPHFRLSLIGAPMALNQKQVFDSCSRSEHRPARARTAAAGRKISFFRLTRPHATRSATPHPTRLFLARASPLREIRGRITRTPTFPWKRYRPAVMAARSATKTPTNLFGKGEGFALAGTGDAVETLSRD